MFSQVDRKKMIIFSSMKKSTLKQPQRIRSIHHNVNNMEYRQRHLVEGSTEFGNDTKTTIIITSVEVEIGFKESDSLCMTTCDSDHTKNEQVHHET